MQQACQNSPFEGLAHRAHTDSSFRNPELMKRMEETMNMMDATVGMLKAVISENRRLQNQVRNLSNGFENLGRGFENLGRGFENLNRNLSSGLEILTKKFEENSNIEFYKMIGIVIIAVCAVIIAGFIAGLYVKSVKGNENCPEKGRTDDNQDVFALGYNQK